LQKRGCRQHRKSNENEEFDKPQRGFSLSQAPTRLILSACHRQSSGSQEKPLRDSLKLQKRFREKCFGGMRINRAAVQPFSRASQSGQAVKVARPAAQLLRRGSAAIALKIPAAVLIWLQQTIARRAEVGRISKERRRIFHAADG